MCRCFCCWRAADAWDLDGIARMCACISSLRYHCRFPLAGGRRCRSRSRRRCCLLLKRYPVNCAPAAAAAAAAATFCVLLGTKSLPVSVCVLLLLLARSLDSCSNFSLPISLLLIAFLRFVPAVRRANAKFKKQHDRK